MDGQCHKGSLCMILNEVENIFEFNENFIKSYNDESDGGYFLEVDV